MSVPNPIIPFDPMRNAVMKAETPSRVAKIFETTYFAQEHGTVRLEQWPEGIVLWCGGQIAWKSWKPATELTLVVDCSNAIEQVNAALAATPDLQPIAWRGDGEDETRKFTAIKRVAEIWAEQGLTVTPLYDAPAPEPQPEVVAVARHMLDKWQNGADGDDVFAAYANDLSAALSTPPVVEEAVKADAWQDIATAPKDWSDVLLHDPDLDSDSRTVCEGWFDRDDGKWKSRVFGTIHPTHWRPLSPPPARSATP